MRDVPDGLTVRLIEPGDSRAELTAFLHRAYATLEAMGLKYYATYQGEDATARRIAGAECYLAHLDGRLAGTVTFRGPAKSRGCPWYERPDVATFNQLAVDPDFRGRGIGAHLLDIVERRAIEAGAREIACDTSEDAGHLIVLYARRGYRFIEHVDWRPVTNYRSVILSKQLPGQVPDAGPA